MAVKYSGALIQLPLISSVGIGDVSHIGASFESPESYPYPCGGHPFLSLQGQTAAWH